jgi:hypothetical protein
VDGAEADILIFGTGSFAARIVFDLAATARVPIRVVVAGRDAERLAWLRTAANARAVIFGCAAEFGTDEIDLTAIDATAALLARLRPSVVVQAASMQTASVISTQGDAWSKLVAEGGLSVTAVFQSMLSLHVLSAIRAAELRCHFINCCFPDVVNGLLVACGHRVDCGIGNIGILSNAFAAEAGVRQPGALRMIAHYQTIGTFRRLAAAREGPYPRVWIGDQEVADVADRFHAVKLTPAPAVEISGATGVPLVWAMAASETWRGHVPGPNGLPGGYPATFCDGAIVPDLPSGLSLDAAIAWNRGFEERNGLILDAGRARYCGVLHERLRAVSPDLARGFEVTELERVCRAMRELRDRLQAQI